MTQTPQSRSPSNKKPAVRPGWFSMDRRVARVILVDAFRSLLQKKGGHLIVTVSAQDDLRVV